MEITDAQFSQAVHAARSPIAVLLNQRLIADRKAQNRFPLSDSAFIYRWVELFFALDSPEVKIRLCPRARDLVESFAAEFRALPWQVVPSHPHISELKDGSLLDHLEPVARMLDSELQKLTENKK